MSPIFVRPRLRISQRHLEILENCPRQFQQIFLDHLAPLPSPQQQESMAVGTQFHQLMQQRSLGLSVDALVAVNPQICQWWDDFQTAIPELFPSQLDDGTFRQAEHERTLSVLGFSLVVRYDFIMAREYAHIFDWKTYSRPRDPQPLERHWQTRLYPYVLAETSDYDPDRISMTYWFVPSTGDQTQPQFYQFPYSQSQHQQTHADLTRLLSQLRDWFAQYQNGQPFPSAPQLSSRCSLCPSAQCQYLSEDDRDGSAKTDLRLNIAEIPEIPI